MSGQGHNRFWLATPPSHAVVESRQIIVLGVSNSPGDLEQDRSQVGIAFGRLATEPFASCNGYFRHPFVHPAYKRSTNNILSFHEGECIMQMSAKSRENLPSWQSENFCQNAQKEQVKTFVIGA